MNTKKSLKISALRGLCPLSAGLFACGAAQAAEDGSASMDWRFWLASQPEWLPMAVSGVAFALIAWLLLLMYRRARGAAENRPLASLYAVLGGGVLGVLAVLLGGDLWKYQEISQLPPSSAGAPQSQRAAVAALLNEPDAYGIGATPSTPPKVLPGRARHVTVNLDAMDADTLLLNLFGDTTLTAVRDRIVKDNDGGAAWIGHVDDDPNSVVVLNAKGKALMGTVAWNGRTFEIVYVNGNTHAVRETNPNKLPPQFEPKMAKLPNLDTAAGGDTTTTSTTSTTTATGTATGQVIDVLVVYTPKALNNAGGASGIQTKIMNAVSQANQAYLNSVVNMQLNLVAMVQTNYTESGDMVTDLSRIQNPADGYMDEVPNTLRPQYAADQVVLISADSNYCGYSYIMTSVGSSFAPYAYAVLHDDSVYNCLAGNNSFAHELGHGQGNVHDQQNATFAGAYSDSYGYRVCGSFHDIMGYYCTTEPRIPYFSNPDVYWNGQPTGILGSSNTARSMNATASTVAGFGAPATVGTVPNAPSNLAAAVVSSSSVKLTWTDNATNETGFQVQRSVDGVNWTLIATLASNTVSFADSGLSAATQYYYQVYAYNSIGNSAFSNSVSTKTSAAAVADTTAPVVTISNPKANAVVASPNQSISVSASDNVSISSLKLYIDKALVGSANTGSLSYSWNTKKLAAGSHTITATALDPSGNSATSTVNVTK